MDWGKDTVLEQLIRTENKDNKEQYISKLRDKRRGNSNGGYTDESNM